MDKKKAPSQKMWYVKNLNQQVFGPMSSDEVIAQIQTGFFLGQELIASVNDGQWIPITQNPHFFEAIVEGLDRELKINDESVDSKINSEATYIEEDSKGIERPVPLWKTLKLDPPPAPEVKAPPQAETPPEHKPIPQVPRPPAPPQNRSTSFFIFLGVLA
ncbi:MAG: hypothetical protein IT287_09445, partial [Bdellovibrionaceae bacterium]|nr:hypothetical protein [Pseudobdellovibrionaceae bacterium]